MNKRPMTSEIIGKAHKLVEVLESPGGWGHPALNNNVPIWAREVRGAVKIYGGLAADLPRFPVDGFPDGNIKLPFPLVLVEYVVPMHMAGDSQEADVTLFAICRQQDGKVSVTFLSNHGSDRWGVVGGCTLECRGSAGVLPHSYVHSGPVSVEHETAIYNASQGLYWVLGAMSCSNVALVDQAPPDALNRKRSKSGKVPLFTYKTLHIVTDRDRTKRTARENDTEARQSPRLHLRRGHIRRLDEARMIWVQPAMVGDPERGKVVNAYALSRKGGHGH